MRSGATTVRPSGFFQPDAIFARNLFGATPALAVKLRDLLDPILDAAGDVDAERLVEAVLGHIEVGLVQRQPFNQRRDFLKMAKTCCDTLRYF